MKKIIGIISAACLILQIFSLTVTSVSAADELTLNKKAKAKTGDKINYTLYLADTEEEIEGFEMQMRFDKDKLEIDSDSFSFPNINGVVENVVGGDVFINWTNISNKLNFSEKKVFLSVDFSVKAGGETSITQFVKEMYGSNMGYLKKFTWTYSVKLNDKEVIKDQPPLLTDIEIVKANNLQGAYVNYADGKGEENGGDAANREAVTDPDSNLLQNRDNEQQNMAGQTATRIVQDIQDVTRVVEKDGKSQGLPVGVIVGIAVVVIVGLVVLAVPLSKKHKKNNNNEP